MKFACDSCQTKYSIPDEKVRGKVLKIRCKKCGSVITVREEAAAPAPIPVEVEQPPEERTRVADLATLEKLRQQNQAPPPAEAPEPIEWFAMIGGQQAGPFSPDEIKARALSGQITLRSHVWRDGMGDWKRAEDVDDVKGLFPKAPAPPPPSAPPRRPPTPVPALRNAATDEGDATIGMSRPDLAAAMSALTADEPVPAKKSRPEVKVATAQAASLASISPVAEVRPKNGSSSSLNLADLVASDLEHAAAEHSSGAQPVVPDDPFAHVPDSPGMQQPVIGEQTRFFMKKAGVTNRNPWWKYVIFVVSMLGLPVAAVYGLGKAGVGGQRTIIDSNGEEQSVPTFSAKGLADVTGLGSLLLGQKHGTGKEVASATPKPHVPKRAPTPGVDPKVSSSDKSGLPDAGLSREQHVEIASLYQQIDTEGHSNKAPVVPKDAHVQQVAGAALSEEAIQKVVGNNSKAFERCMDDELRHNPNAKGGKVMLHLTIKATGKVSSPTIVNRPEMNSSSLGDCIKSRATRMAFPPFEGDDQEVEFPLVLANGG